MHPSGLSSCFSVTIFQHFTKYSFALLFFHNFNYLSSPLSDHILTSASLRFHNHVYFWFISPALCLTFYNFCEILPTLFFETSSSSKPLKEHERPLKVSKFAVYGFSLVLKGFHSHNLKCRNTFTCACLVRKSNLSCLF